MEKETLKVTKVWLETLLKLSKEAKEAPKDDNFFEVASLIGYASSAEFILKDQVK